MQGEKIHTLSDLDNPCRIFTERMREGALILSCEGTITYCNRPFAEMLERSVSQVQGYAIFNFLVESDIGRIKQILMPSPGNIQIEITFRSCDSRPIPTLFSIGKREDAGRQSIFAVVIERVEYRQAGRKQDNDRKRLEAMIEERSHELAMTQDDLATFSSSVSHDLRAPLRHIQSFAELLADRLQEVPDNQSRHYLEVISNAATDMNRSIDQLISLFKIDRSAMHFIRVDLNDLVYRVVNAFQPETTGRSVEWDIGDLPDVSGDLAMLQIVFANLMSNALKFTRLQAVARIRIAVDESGSDDSDFIVLAIKDNGIGFDMQHHDKLFGIFQRMHNQNEFEGAGIGLAYVKRIVQRHGGHVWAKGALKQGAEFFISLPKFVKEQPVRQPDETGSVWGGGSR